MPFYSEKPLFHWKASSIIVENDKEMLGLIDGYPKRIGINPLDLLIP